jgi:hypothetical protein
LAAAAAIRAFQSKWVNKKNTHLVQAFPENLYREKPRLEIFGLEQLDTCPWGGRRLKGDGQKGDNRAEVRTSRSLRGIGLFDLDFLQLLLQPSGIYDRHGRFVMVGWGWWGFGGRRRGGGVWALVLEAKVERVLEGAGTAANR